MRNAVDICEVQFLVTAVQAAGSLHIPEESLGTFHIILELTDDGRPQLKSYRRVIFNVK